MLPSRPSTLLVLVALAGACTRHVVKVETEPAGAEVTINGTTQRGDRWSLAPDSAAALQVTWPDGKRVATTLLVDRDARIIVRRDGDPGQISGARVVGAAPGPAPIGPAAAAPAATPPTSDPMTRARELYDAGQKAYELTEYDEAIARFKEAYELIRGSDHPEAPEILGNVIYNLAVVYERSYEVTPDPERLRRARVMYRQYDEQMSTIVPKWAASPEHADVLARIRALDARLGTQK